MIGTTILFVFSPLTTWIRNDLVTGMIVAQLVFLVFAIIVAISCYLDQLLVDLSHFTSQKLTYKTFVGSVNSLMVKIKSSRLVR